MQPSLAKPVGQAKAVLVAKLRGRQAMLDHRHQGLRRFAV